MAASMKMHALPAMTACIACMPVVVEGNTCNGRRRFISEGIACNKTILAALNQSKFTCSPCSNYSQSLNCLLYMGALPYKEEMPA